MVEESNPSHSFELIAQHEALTDKLTIQNNKGALISRTTHPSTNTK